MDVDVDVDVTPLLLVEHGLEPRQGTVGWGQCGRLQAGVHGQPHMLCSARESSQSVQPRAALLRVVHPVREACCDVLCWHRLGGSIIGNAFTRHARACQYVSLQLLRHQLISSRQRQQERRITCRDYLI